MRRIAMSLRWSFNIKNWLPSENEWTSANRIIQIEESERIDRFVFQNPAKSAMIGRLLLRKAVCRVTSQRNAEVILKRDSHGRPFLQENLSKFDVNVSHHGDWVILAMDDKPIGTDLVSLDRPVNIELDEYFRLMTRQFTPHEWTQINRASNKLHTFYRFWCLKESYVKMDGVGLNMDLQRISFTINESLGQEKTTTSSTLILDGSPARQYQFQETLIDANHCASVCICYTQNPVNSGSVALQSVSDIENQTNSEFPEKPFIEVDIGFLLDCNGSYLQDFNSNWWNNFSIKKLKP